MVLLCLIMIMKQDYTGSKWVCYSGSGTRVHCALEFGNIISLLIERLTLLLGLPMTFASEKMGVLNIVHKVYCAYPYGLPSLSSESYRGVETIPHNFCEVR